MKAIIKAQPAYGKRRGRYVRTSGSIKVQSIALEPGVRYEVIITPLKKGEK